MTRTPAPRPRIDPTGDAIRAAQVAKAQAKAARALARRQARKAAAAKPLMPGDPGYAEAFDAAVAKPEPRRRKAKAVDLAAFTAEAIGQPATKARKPRHPRTTGSPEAVAAFHAEAAPATVDAPAVDSFDQTYIDYLNLLLDPSTDAKTLIRARTAHTNAARDVHGNRATARRGSIVKALTVANRILLAPRLVPGLTGSARTRWIETGLSSAEQLADDKSNSALLHVTRNPSRRTAREAADAIMEATEMATTTPNTGSTRRPRKNVTPPVTETDVAATKARIAKARSGGKASAPARPAPTGVTVSQLADQLGTDGRRLRAFLRSSGLAAGKGGRYDFSKAEVAKVTKAWKAAQAK